MGVSEMPLSSKKAVIIGGETGIGFATARYLASKGAEVIIGGVLEDAWAATSQQIPEGAKFIYTDAEDFAAIDALFRSAGRTDILVYAAGVADGKTNCVDTSNELWEKVINVNLRGCFYACRAAIPSMTANNYGRIITISSLSAVRSSVNGLPYTVSKHAMTGLTKSIAVEYAKYGITANSVLPGSIETEIGRNTARLLGKELLDPKRLLSPQQADYKALIPAQRRGTADEVASVVGFLASDEAAYVTGQMILVDGGWGST
jgi:NAD(P)-dependent dehydrogenase (short-subunit alcohol dehydrogenase family)